MTEEWYGTQYKQEAISEETIKVNDCLQFFCCVISV